MKQLLVVLFLVLVFVLPANAQTFRGAINGTVTDPSGASVPGATVKATDTATNIERTTLTTGDGQFAFQELPVGSDDGAARHIQVACKTMLDWRRRIGEVPAPNEAVTAVPRREMTTVAREGHA